MNESFENLDWDSSFFGYNVANINLHSKAELPNILKRMSENNIRLAYLATAKSLGFVENEFYDFNLVDKKITFSKTIRLNNTPRFPIESYLFKSPNTQLYKLAIASGIYSRFNIDSNIQPEKFEELYKLWLINSLNGKFAKEVLVAKVDSSISGIVTIREKEQKATIGIIAVSPAFRSQGIGKELMKAAENWAYYSNFQVIDVVTQEQNIAACHLYRKLDYHITDTQYVYHLWSKRLK